MTYNGYSIEYNLKFINDKKIPMTKKRRQNKPLNLDAFSKIAGKLEN